MRIFSLRKSVGYPDSHRKIENGFRQIRKALQHRASADKYHARARLPFITGAANFVADKMDDLFGARLQDIAEYGMRDGAGLARPHAHDFENMILVGSARGCASLFAFQTFRFRN